MARPVSQGGIDYYDGGFISGGQTFPVIGDLAELAARIGSIVTHNREGLVTFLESFTGGLAAWTITANANGGQAIASNLKYRSPPYSCKMVSRDSPYNSISIQRWFPSPVLGTIGLEFSFMIGDDAQRIQWFLSHYDGTERHYYAFQYHVADEAIKLYDAGYVWLTIVQDLDLANSKQEFNTVKMVVNLEDEKHVRLIVNNVEYNTSLYGPVDAPDSDGPSVEVWIQVLDEDGTNGFCYVDDIIFTLVEPTR